MTLWIQQRGLCWICGEPMQRFVPMNHPLGVSRDHLRPRSRGGGSRVRNYLLAHQKCNTDRGAPNLNMTNAELQSLKQRALLKLRSSPHWVDDFKDPANGAYRGSGYEPLHVGNNMKFAFVFSLAFLWVGIPFAFAIFMLSRIGWFLDKLSLWFYNGH